MSNAAEIHVCFITRAQIPCKLTNVSLSYLKSSRKYQTYNLGVMEKYENIFLKHLVFIFTQQFFRV